MAKKHFWIGTTGPFIYDDANDVLDRAGLLPAGTKCSGMVAEGKIKALGAPVDNKDMVRLEDVSELLDGTLANDKLVRTDATGRLTSADLSDFADGTVNEITVTDNGDGTITVSLPDSIELDGATATRLLATDANKRTISVTDLTNWIAGTANEITVTDDGDGTVTLEGAGSDTNFTVITALQAGGAGAVGFQYKTRDLTLNGGIISTVGVESAWNDV